MDELADVAVAAREIEKLRAKKERERKLAAARKAKQRERDRIAMGAEAFAEKHRHEVKKSYWVTKIRAEEEKKEADDKAVHAAALAEADAKGHVVRTRLQKGADVLRRFVLPMEPEGLLRVCPEPGCVGRGVMVTRDILPNKTLGLYKGKPLNEQQMRRQLKLGNGVMIELTTAAAVNKVYINPKDTKDNILKYINHGCHDCEANCSLGLAGDNDLEMSSTKFIKAFSYLRWDYRITLTDDDDDEDLGWLRKYWAAHDAKGKCAGQSRADC
jgi:hypothetical protein